MNRSGPKTGDRRAFGRRAATGAMLLVLSSTLVSCTVLTPATQPPEYTTSPGQGALWETLDFDHQQNWFKLLNYGPDALDWRLRAIDSATDSIDLQTFLWTMDTTGALILDHLVRAAERGVKVKLLIDDTFLNGQDTLLLELHHHPNIEYRVFNPYKRRSSSYTSRLVLNLAEFHRLDHRMHNKAMVVDNAIAIVGGRNLADEYFGLHADANFRDLELITGGPIVQTIAYAFDDYWNDKWSVPIDQLAHVNTSHANLDEVRHLADQSDRVHNEETAEARLLEWQNLILEALPGQPRLIVDVPPVGNPGEASEAPVQVASELYDVFDKAQREIIIVSAYLIPADHTEALFKQATQRGVRIRILTNSIASNNHLSAHSAYRNHVDTLLSNGAEMHEVRIDAQDRHLHMLSPVETKALGLHAKALIVDDDLVFIGSPNLDPRSLRINTEMGLLIRSEALNRATRAAVAPDFEITNAWHLRFDEKGNVEWVSDDRTLSVQPATSFMQRIEDWFFSHLPIEDEL